MRQRLDVLLVARGLAPSRERARSLILAGHVRVDGSPAVKAGTAVDETADIVLDTPDHPYVSRGGIKLAHALDTFNIAADGRSVLDIGASTGGFTDVLLQRGARHVVALDVGHGQLDWRLRTDPRVTVREHVNARFLTAADLPGPFDVITIDVSFISLRHILPVVPPLLAADGDVVALVKPQFEAGREEVQSGGLVLDPAVHRRVITAAKEAGRAVGLEPVHELLSTDTAATENQEFLLHFRRPS